jgi:hypothetical protein
VEWNGDRPVRSNFSAAGIIRPDLFGDSGLKGRIADSVFTP